MIPQMLDETRKKSQNYQTFSSPTFDPHIVWGTKLGREFINIDNALWRLFIDEADSFTCCISVAGFKTV